MYQQREEREEHVIQLFRAVNRMHHRAFDKQVDSFGISHVQHRILMFLYRTQTAPSQRTVAEEFEISPAAVAVLLKKLEQDGYIVRTASPEDNRYHRVVITEKGVQLAERTQDQFAGTDRIMFEDLTEQEKEVFANCLKKMHASLERLLSRDGATKRG